MKAKYTGFSLVELMFVIALAAVLLGAAIPNFRPFLQNGRMTKVANDLLADINVARSEALKRRVPVTICASTNSESASPSCANNGSFAQWIVFVDAEADGVVDDLVADVDGDGDMDQLVLRRGKGLPSPFNSTPNAGGDRLTYLASGFPSPSADRVNFIRLCDSRGNKVSVGGSSAARLIAISATGRPAVYRDIQQITDTVGDCP